MWVSVNERMPTPKKLSRINVKITFGSTEKKEIESCVLCKPWNNSGQFIVGEWQKVTHWWDDKAATA